MDKQLFYSSRTASRDFGQRERTRILVFFLTEELVLRSIRLSPRTDGRKDDISAGTDFSALKPMLSGLVRLEATSHQQEEGERSFCSFLDSPRVERRSSNVCHHGNTPLCINVFRQQHRRGHAQGIGLAPRRFSPIKRSFFRQK